MTSFFNQLSQIETDSSEHNNPYATPTPVDVAATERLLQDQFYALRRTASDSQNATFLESLIEFIQSQIESPPEKVAGVPQSFLDALDRVPLKHLKKTDACPICGECFLDDEYPLVVQLPCHPAHRFDLECVGPWLRLQGTCPLDRKDLTKKKEAPGPVNREREVEEEENYESMYAWDGHVRCGVGDVTMWICGMARCFYAWRLNMAFVSYSRVSHWIVISLHILRYFIRRILLYLLDWDLIV